MNRPTGRVLTLLELLQSGGTRTMAELADRLGVDARTVRRYVDHLIDLDVPVESVRGRYGGYRLAPGYRLPPLMLSDDEALAVMLGLVAGQRTGLATATGTASETAAAKIRRVLPPPLARRLEAVLGSLAFTNERGTNERGTNERGANEPGEGAAPDGEVLLAVADAVRHRRPVSVKYTDREGARGERTLHPYGIVNHRGRWYVRGRDPAIDEERTFRLDRIEKARALPGSFEPPAEADVARQVLDGFATAAYRHRVTIWIRGTAEQIRTRLPASVATVHQPEAAVELEPGAVADGWLRVELRVERLDWLPPVLASLDLPFAVERPDELRNLVAALAERLAASASAQVCGGLAIPYVRAPGGARSVMASCFWPIADTVDNVRADLLDLALLVIAVAFAISGYRQGFIVGSLSFIGFVGGAVIGASFGPSIARAIVGGQTHQDVLAVVLLMVFAIVGQFVFSSVGAYVRQTMTSPSSTVLDAVGGSVVSVLSMLLIAWAIGSVLTASSFSGVVSQVDNSAVLTTMDKVMPSPAKTMFSEFRRLLASGPFPQVFSGIGAAHLFAISAPDQVVLNSPGYLAARSRVLKVQGTALSCNHDIEGSGFVFAPDHVLTNAHVVAGVNQSERVTTPDGRTLPATVVLYDPQVDLAVLYVPGLNLTPLHFDTSGQAGDSAVVAGYPLNQGFTQDAARIGGTQNAVGPDIYQTGQVNRQIFEIRSTVRPGNSGGPLLSPAGAVYGVVFAAAVNTSNTGFALTASEVAADAQAGATQTTPTSTQGCD